MALRGLKHNGALVIKNPSLENRVADSDSQRRFREDVVVLAGFLY